MRSQLGETCQILGFVGQVACRTETSAFVEFGGIGFLSVLSDCEGRHDCIITLSVPTSMSASISSHTAVAEIKRQVCLFFDLTPRRIVVKLCTPHEVRSEAEPFIAEVVTAELAESTAQSYPDWPSVYAAPPMPNASAAGRSPYLLVFIPFLAATICRRCSRSRSLTDCCFR